MGIYVPEHLMLKRANKGYAVLAARRIAEGEAICEIYFDSIRPRRTTTRKSIQIWEDAFLNSRLRAIDDYFNHSCNPNSVLHFPNYVLRALRVIDKGEEITWNYLTTEFNLARDGQDFDCECSSDNCVGHVKGFTYLTEEQKLRLLPWLSTYLRTKFFGIEFPGLENDGTLVFV